MSALEAAWPRPASALAPTAVVDGGAAPAAPPPRRPAYERVARGCALLGYALFLGGGGEGGASSSTTPPLPDAAAATSSPSTVPPPAGALLIATDAPAAAYLPGGHVVRAVKDSKWVPVPVLAVASSSAGGEGAACAAATARAAEAADALARFRVAGAHYFCDTFDVTRPWTHAAVAARAPPPAWEFVWNTWLAAPFSGLGLPPGAGPPPLLQGSATSATLSLPPPLPDGGGGGRFGYALLTRVSRLHAGTRYRARGLNAEAGPGNEVEVEQLVWRGGGGGGDSNSSGEGGAVPDGGLTPPLTPGSEACAAPPTTPHYPAPPLPPGATAVASAVWRRGTVPVWWGVELRGGGVGEASIVIRPPPGTYVGTRRYFRRLQKRYGRWEAAGAGRGAGGQGGTPAPPPSDPSSASVRVVCVNLLRCAPTRRDELCLSEHLAEGVRRASAAAPAGKRRAPGGGGGADSKTTTPPLPLLLVNFDWHAICKDLSPAGAVEGLWARLGPLLADIGLTVGVLGAVPGGGPAAAAAAVEPPAFTLTAAQDGLLRFNCADSLDRTNAASYFVGVALAAEQCRVLGLRVWEAGLGATKAATKPARKQSPSFQPPLPAHWEARIHPNTGRVFYLDHATKMTTWLRPGVAVGGGEEKETVAEEALLPPDPSPAAPPPPPPPVATPPTTPPWSVIADGTVPAARTHLLPALLAASSSAFRLAGDVISHMYTASPAMHADVLALLLSGGESDGAGAVDSDREDGAAASASAAVADAADAAAVLARAGGARLRNVGLSVQRRFYNVTRDGGRQAALELFLGGKGGNPPPPEHSESEADEEGGVVGTPPPAAVVVITEAPPLPPPAPAAVDTSPAATVVALAAVTAGEAAPPPLTGLALVAGGGEQQQDGGGSPSPPPSTLDGLDPLGVGVVDG